MRKQITTVILAPVITITLTACNDGTPTTMQHTLTADTGKAKYDTLSAAKRDTITTTKQNTLSKTSQARQPKSAIAKRVIKMIVDKLGVDESEVTPEASFTNDLGADSLDTVELVKEFEKEFNISIPDAEAETKTTVGQAIAYIESHVK